LARQIAFTPHETGIALAGYGTMRAGLDPQIAQITPTKEMNCGRTCAWVENCGLDRIPWDFHSGERYDDRQNGLRYGLFGCLLVARSSFARGGRRFSV
jgi:hypothetical protein